MSMLEWELWQVTPEPTIELAAWVAQWNFWETTLINIPAQSEYLSVQTSSLAVPKLHDVKHTYVKYARMYTHLT